MRKRDKGNSFAISACLLGVPCRWNKKSKFNSQALKIFLKGKAIIICPEVIAGLSTPRPACEIKDGDGVDVLKKKAKVVDIRGTDYTKKYIKGAEKTLKLIKSLGITKVFLKSGSPSCGVKFIFSGLFNDKKKSGCGVLTALLLKNKIVCKELG